MVRVSYNPKLMTSLDIRKQFKKSNLPILASPSVPTPFLGSPLYDKEKRTVGNQAHPRTARSYFTTIRHPYSQPLRGPVMRHDISSRPRGHGVAPVSVPLRMPYRPTGSLVLPVSFSFPSSLSQRLPLFSLPRKTCYMA